MKRLLLLLTLLAITNGSLWAQYPSGSSLAVLYMIWGSSSADIWAVGQGGTILHYHKG